MSTLLLDIEAFLAETGMGVAYFGKASCGNTELVRRLRRETTPTGRPVRIWPETERQIRDFMAVQRARRCMRRAS